MNAQLLPRHAPPARPGFAPFLLALPATEAAPAPHPQRAVVRIMQAGWAAWHRAFPTLHRRADWHIVQHLCAVTEAGTGRPIPFGELCGALRQAMLLDEATVRDRVASLIAAGWCTASPAPPLAARTLLAPTAALRARHAETLAGLLAAVTEAAPDLPAPPSPAPCGQSARDRALHAQAVCESHWAALQAAVFEAACLSPARRLEARRHLHATSHRTLLLAALGHAFGPGDTPGLLADRLGAHVLDLTGQSVQTTRAHLATLMALGLLERAPGRALSVRLAAGAQPHAVRVLGAAARALAGVVW